MRLRELDGFIRHTARWTPVKNIVIGLDLFMFNSHHKWEAGYDQTLSHYSYYARMLLASLTTNMALGDARQALDGGIPKDGYWTRSGYKHSNPRSAEQMKWVLNSFYVEKFAITDDEYDILDDLLSWLERKKIGVSIYLSPLNRIMIERMKQKGRYEVFSRWRQQVKAVSQRRNARFFDFSENNPFFETNMLAGSTLDWIDPSHYSPHVGAWIIKKTTSIVE
jgi:hypothetical protein